MTSSITSAGSASGIDFESIIEALVEAKETSLSSTVSTAKAETEIELQGVETLKSALETFQSALEAFTEDNAFNARTITIDQPSDTTYFTVTADDDVSNMTHDVIVEQLASSQKVNQTIAIDEEAGLPNAFAAGTLTFTLGTDSDGNEITYTVTIDEGDSLELIRKKINENDYGLTANYVLTENGYSLTIDTNKTGSDNNFLTITATTTGDTDSYQSLDIFNYKSTSEEDEGNWTTTDAQDAIIRVDGEKVTSSSNVFDEQISGVTITVKKVSAYTEDEDGNRVYTANTFTVEEDYDTVASKMQSFVEAYNTLISAMDELYTHNTYTDGENNYDGGDLAGDAMLRTLKSQLQNMVSSFGYNANTGQSIYNMGLSFESDGTLSLDSSTFKEALADNFNLVVNSFSGTDGLLTQLDEFLDEYTKSTGILADRITSLNEEISDYELKESENEEYLEQYEASLRSKYSYLDTLIASYNNSLSLLTSALG